MIKGFWAEQQFHGINEDGMCWMDGEEHAIMSDTGIPVE
jgi:hypothetical protein